MEHFFYYLYELGIDLKHNLELPISQIDNFTLYAFFGVFRESMYVKSTIYITLQNATYYTYKFI